MPPQSRAQRRRQAQRTGKRPPRPAPSTASAGAGVEELPALESPAAPAVEPEVSPQRPARSGRRSAVRTLEPVDYSQDYASARRDLIRIGVISLVLFAVMVALSFSGLL